jgi:hypothetical protein
MMKKLICVMGLLTVGFGLSLAWGVEPVWNYAVQLSAAVQASPAQVTLSWPQDSSGTPNSYTVYRKAPGATSWGSGTTLPGSATSFVDGSVALGTTYEYAVVKNAGGYNGYGYIQSGINVPLLDSRGKVLLIVENSYAGNLSAELSRLQQDLAGDGWTVLRHDVNRNDSVSSVKNLIKADYSADPATVKAVFLFGHVPVPYSGQLNPDGHSDHIGAWPADVFYGDMDGTWTDNSVNYLQTQNTDPADAARLSNVPGDGKFDQTTIPSAVELQVGRVDLANMPGRLVWGGPATFPSEQELLRQYLNKDHNFRHKLMSAPRRGLVADYFGVRNGEAFGASGYRSFTPFFGANNIANLNVIYNDQKGEWVPELGANAYLWAYGCGAGSYLTIAGLGNTGLYNDASTTEVVNNNVRAVFTLLFGSWNGDWDHEDDFLRAILATKDYGLAAAWSGRPHWFVHPMGLGETIGYCARLTQNNTGLYQNQINTAANYIHIALMGDPTLRLHPVAPPGSLGGTASPGSVSLSWTASPDSVVGYHVYRATSANGPFTRLSSSLLATTSFLDGSAPSGAIYMVRAVKLENSPSGSYYNASQGLFWTAGGTPPPSGDTTPPTISLNAPASGATVSGASVTISANASDNVGVLGVQFKLDGANLGAEDLAAPYSLSWDTTGTANGSHTLTAVARDLAGNQSTATTISVTVSNAASVPVTDLPTVTITSADATATEGATDTASFTLTRTGSTASDLPVTLSASGTATKWDDYRRPVQGDMPDTWIIPAGSGSVTITVIAVDDTSVEGTETAKLTIQASPAYTVGTPNSVTLTILDNDGTTADTTAPTVSLSAPANNATVSGSSLTISANAADNVAVVGVQFKLDGANLGAEDTSAPYSVMLDTTTIADGSHTLSAVARDAAGNQASAAPTTILVSNSSSTATPTVSITSTDATATEGPTDTASFTLTRTGSTANDLAVTLSAGGTATKWDDYRRPVQGDMPDTWIIPAGASSVTITVMAVDDTTVEGTETGTLTIQSSPNYTVGTPNSVTLTILDNDSGTTPPPTADTTAPTVSLSAPANNATLLASSTTVSANAADNVGVVGVQFKLDGANLGAEATTAPYSVTWNTSSSSAGAHVLTAVARDAAGNRTTSAPISVTLATSTSTTSTLPSWVGAPGHNWTPRLGGVYWLNSRAILKQVAPYFAEYSKPVLVDIKSNVTGFGYRFDLDSWDSREESHSWFLWNGTDQGTPASPEDAFNILGASGNAEFILNIPIPETLTTSPSGDGFGYTWQTPQFYAAMVQYLFGTAGSQAEWQGLPTALDFFAQPASFNWANLRARRGHVNPYPVVAVIIGEEPYNLEGLPDGASYGAQAEQFRLAIRNRAATVPLGLHVRDMGLVDDPDPTKWFWPMMNNLTESDFSFIDLEHYYQFSTVSEDYKRTYPVSINPSGFQGWWLPQSSWKSDYTKNLWIIEDTRHALRDFGGAGVGDPNRWQLGFSEHGIQISSQFLYNDMFSAVHWASWLAEAMRQNITWDSGWTLVGEGFATAALQVRNGYVTRTPMFYVYQMAQEFSGYDYLDNTYSSTMGSTVDNLGRAVQFPWTVVRVFRDPATANIHLFTLNQSPTQSATLSGFENWTVLSWKQLKGDTYSDGNLLGVSGPETIQTRALTTSLSAGASLEIPPVSVNHIVLAPSNSTNPPPADLTPPSLALTSPANGATVSGSAVTVSANASDNVGVVGVQFKLDGANLGVEETTTPYSVNWNTTAVADGAHVLTALARDAAGNQTTASAVSVLVSNSAPITPTVTVAATDPNASRVGPDNGTFTITRTGSTAAALTVNYSLGGTAINGIDYNSLSGSATIAAGSASAAVVIVPKPATSYAGSKSVTLALAANAAYNLGSAGSATVTVAGNGVSIKSIKATRTSVTISWTSVAGRIYHVAYKNSLSDATWTDLSGNVTATGTTTSWTDTTANKSTQRYYAVYVVN